jgi:DNA replication protein DnaC
MKKQIVRSLDIDRIPIQRLTALLETFTLKHSARGLADLLEKAEVNELSYREFLLTLLETEVRGRNERRRKRNLSAAHFPPHPKMLDDFDPTELDAGITESQIQTLRELSWLDTCGNLVFAGPPGLGKTMLAVGLGLEAVNAGYTVCFERMTNFVKILDTADTERAAGFRLRMYAWFMEIMRTRGADSLASSCPTKMDCDHKRSWQDPALFAGKFTIHSHTDYLL